MLSAAPPAPHNSFFRRETFGEARTSEDRNFGVMVIQSENYIFLGAMIYQQKDSQGNTPQKKGLENLLALSNK
jgi:hypothetical protein